MQFTRLMVAGVGVALLLGLVLASARRAGADLVANPLLARELPPPGWVADHPESWVGERPVYRSSCRSREVTAEVQFLNRIIGHDEYLLSLVTSPVSADPATERQARLARQETPMLRRDIAAADGLVARLEALPACPPGTTAKPAAEPVPATAPAAPQASAAAVAPTAEPAGMPRRVIRFDDRVAALTPSSIKTLNDAIAAALSGKPVQLVIEGCNARADFAPGSPCSRRRHTLERRLAASGVNNPASLFAVPTH